MKNTYNKKCTQESLNSYKKPQTFCANLHRKTKLDHCNNLKIKDLSDNRKLCKTIKPYFSNKRLNSKSFFLLKEIY